MSDRVRLLIARLIAASVGIVGAGGLLLGMNPYAALSLMLGCVVLILTIEKARP